MGRVLSKEARKTEKSARTNSTGNLIVHEAKNVYHVKDGTVIHKQCSSQSSTAQTELDAKKLEHDALEILRKALKKYNREWCKENVTKNFDDLKEPGNEVYPKLIQLLRFYEGELLKVMSQYNKDQAFKYGHEATLPGEELDYKALLRRVIELNTKRIAVIGQAGSGKSVILKRLVRDLTTQDEDLMIFFMNFRDFTDEEKIRPRDLLFRGLLRDSDAEHSYEWILANQDKVMLVLDGLDQATWSVAEEAKFVGPNGTGKVSEIMSSIFQGNLFPDVKVVYSSREHAVASLVGQLRPKMVIALAGLSSSDSEWLFKSFIGEGGELLWEKLRTQSQSFIPLLSIPAYLIFTAIAFKLNSDKPPRSMTRVLQNLLESFMQSGHIVEKDIPTVFTGLKKMSFLGLKDGKVLFYINNIEDAGLDIEKIRDWIIRIPGLNKCNQFLLEGKYVLIFSHQIIQEFLTAQYIVETDFESFRDIVMQYLKNDYWSVVARFVSGLLFDNEIGEELDTLTDVELKRNTFKNMLTEKYRDLSSHPAFSGVLLPFSYRRSFASLLEFMAIVSESNDSVYIRDLVHEIRPGTEVLRESDAYIIASVMRHLTDLNYLNLWFCNLSSATLQVLWDNLEHCSLKILKLNVSKNKLDSKAFLTIGKLAKKCSVRELNVAECNITNEALENLLAACEGALISKFVLSRNSLENMECATIGKIVKKCAVDELIMEACSLNDGKLKNLLLEIEGTKITKFDISHNVLEDDGYATLGKVVKLCAVNKIVLEDCNLSDEKLKNFLSEVQETKISKLYISRNELGDTGYATLGKIVKTCRVEKLKIKFCRLSNRKLTNLLLETKGAKISKLDVSFNYLDKSAAAIVGDIVKQCSVDELMMQKCGLDDGSIEALLLTVTGRKLVKLEISDNFLSSAAVERIRESISVENLKLNVIDEKIKQELFLPKITVEEIGPAGGNIDIFGCTLSIPPGAHQTRRPTQIAVRSSYADAPKGYKIASSELKWDSFGISFEGFATITLPLHAIPDDGHIQILSKQDEFSDWEITDIHPTLKDRKVSFRVPTCGFFKAVFRHTQSFSTYFCHYSFFSASTSELRGVTCIDDLVVRRICIDVLGKKLTASSPVPDKFVLSCGEQVSYEYSCVSPIGTLLEPNMQVLTANDIVLQKQNSFAFLPPPNRYISDVRVNYVRNTSKTMRKYATVLEWRMLETIDPSETLPAARICRKKAKVYRSSSGRPVSMKRHGDQSGSPTIKTRRTDDDGETGSMASDSLPNVVYLTHASDNVHFTNVYMVHRGIHES